MDGFGIFKWMTGRRVGDVYIGEWQEGVRSGKGEYTYASGDKYEGEFLGNAPHGRGRFVQFRTVNVDPKVTKPMDDPNVSSPNATS